MRVTLCNQSKITRLILPSRIEGSFWLVDEYLNNNILSIEANNGSWIMQSNNDAKIFLDSGYVTTLKLENNAYAYIEYNKQKLFVYFEEIYDSSISYYKVIKDVNLIIGRESKKNDILYGNVIPNDYFALSFTQNGWVLSIANGALVYVNNVLVSSSTKALDYGDYIFCFGLRITLYFGMISINNPNNTVRINANKLSCVNIKEGIPNVNIPNEEVKEVDFYHEDDYFFKKARIRRFIETYKLVVTPPPNASKKEDTPALLVLGPMLTMGLVSVITFLNAIGKVQSGNQSFDEALTSIISAGAMLMTSLLWPNLTRLYQKKNQKRKEKERKHKYHAYMDKKKTEIKGVAEEQSQILIENLLPVEDCQSVILEKKINLWERRNDQKDFLTVRVGIGNVPVDMDIQFSEQDFTMDEDALRKETEEIVAESKMLYNVPIGYSFHNKKVTALMGQEPMIFKFVDSVIFQLMTFHSYDDLKIIFLVSKKHLDVWNKYKELPHCFSDNRRSRFFAANIDDAKEVSSILEQEFNNRVANLSQETEENEVKEKTFSPYYLIITDDYPMIRKLGIIENMLEIKEDCGFSLICVEQELRKLPSECVNFVYVDKNSAILCTDINNYYQQQFSNELDYNVNIPKCVEKLANIPIEFTEDLRNLPTSIGFLEMFNVGKVEQLNILNRWKMNNPMQSLHAQVGINDEGNPIYLDLHEKYHGPHGLIAGTTGSGKSEFIITYILSMALNFSPNEVAFILIDYKGGGLAGAFENKTQGIRLPHLAGTITNLDKSELNRTLVSINSELQRRQQKFNEVRDKLGESTIDIYKYQRFFREKKIDEPMPHLFIISDEFAELKAQQPEFMDDLISAARIGRSLGVHLILATQKPSGVVNDQIWSNTKFRVCLKVQDTSDSNEMLKLPDAAYITNAGRFFLQVGNNEILVLGQSGWAGTQYIASNTVKKKYDRSISFIDDIGNVYKNLQDTGGAVATASNGDELSNVLKYICYLADQEKVATRNLWLDSMPGDIYVDNLIQKYNYKKDSNVTAIVGEYDAPSKQYQNILTLPISEDGNTLIYGMDGSSREMFLSSFIYSLCINYDSEDVNMYVVDYGSESLRLYNKFPQVGDVIFASEEDKLQKLFSLVNEELDVRKKMFADYNGEYKTYCKNSGKKLPLKVIIINNYDAFKEGNDQYEDTLVRFTRDGERYGIIFVISATNSRSVYSKLERNFHHTFMINMPDRGDYIDIFGKIGNIYPAEYDGRGLFKMDEVYEFQTAQVCPVDNLIDFVDSKAKEIRSRSSSVAPNVPSLPDVITIEHLIPYMTNINDLPIGMNRKSLKLCTYNFFADKGNIISSKDLENCIELLKTIIYGVRKLNHMTVLIDTEQQLSSIGGMVNTYVDKNFEEFILKFEQFLDTQIDGKNIKVLCIISGLEKFQGSLNEKKFNGFFKGIKTLDNLNLVFVDPSFKLKKIGYEEWYSKTVNNANGIWVGSGFMEQNVISPSDYSNKHKEKLNNQFAWVVKNGEPELIKIVGEKGEEDEK